MAAGGRVRDWPCPVDQEVMAWATGGRGIQVGCPGEPQAQPLLAPPATADPTPPAPTLLEPHGFRGFEGLDCAHLLRRGVRWHSRPAAPIRGRGA